MSTARVLFNRLSHIARQIDNDAGKGVEDAAKAVAADAKGRVPKRTGKTAASIKAEKQGSDWHVVVGHFVGLFLEYGTSRQAARPYLTPAAEAERARIAQRIKVNVR